MIKRRKILCIAGGDMRMKYAAEKLAEVYDVETECRAEKGYADILILPPVLLKAKESKSQDKAEGLPDARSLTEKLKKDGLLFAGLKAEAVEKAAAEKGNTIINYMKDEMLALANAVPTAEGAIVTAIEKTGRTISGSRILVTGCGKTGTALAERLVRLGADVKAAARKEKDRRRIAGLGADAVPFCEISNILAETDIIFNTVPSPVFTEENTEKINGRCTYIELASAPYGADPEIFRKKNIAYVCASGLPPYGM